MTEDRREAPRVPVDKDIEALVSGARVRVAELSVSGALIEHTERFPIKGAQLSMTWNLQTVILPIRVARSEIAGRIAEGLLYKSGIYFVRTDAESDAFITSIIGEANTPAASAAFGAASHPPAVPGIEVPPQGAVELSLTPHMSPDAELPVPYIEPPPVREPLPETPIDLLVRKVQPEAVTVRKIESHHEEPVATLEPPAAAAPPRPAPPEKAPPADPKPSRPQPSSLEDSWVREVNFLRDDPEDQLPYAQYRLTPNGWEKSYVATPDQPEDGFTIERGQKDFIELQRTFEWADEDTRRMLRAGLKARMGQV